MSQSLTGSAKVWFTPAVHVASVPPSRLSATQVIGRSPVIVRACEDHGRRAWIRRPVRVSQREVAPSPAPQARTAPSAEKASEVAPLTWPDRVRATEPVWGSRSWIRPSAPALASDDPSGAKATASTSAA